VDVQEFAMPLMRQALAIVVLGFAMFTGISAGMAVAQSTATEPQLFAVEITVGPRWDQARPPQDQRFFKEHSANLRRMREAGVLVAGARYSDKGLLVVSAASMAEVRDQMAQDPSIGAGTFVYEVHSLNVFYPGELKAGPRR
jgi:hypothetical protein